MKAIKFVKLIAGAVMAAGEDCGAGLTDEGRL